MISGLGAASSKDRGVPCAIPFEGADGAKLYLQGATSQRVEFFIFLFVLLLNY